MASGSERILGACIEVHRHLGPGLLESAYEQCVEHELRERGIATERQVAVPLVYKTLNIPDAYRVDLIVAQRVVLELKTVENLLDVHAAQVITYLRLTDLPIGLLVNFHAATLRGHIRRLVNPTHHVPRVSE